MWTCQAPPASGQPTTTNRVTTYLGLSMVQAAGGPPKHPFSPSSLVAELGLYSGGHESHCKTVFLSFLGSHIRPRAQALTNGVDDTRGALFPTPPSFSSWCLECRVDSKSLRCHDGRCGRWNKTCPWWLWGFHGSHRLLTLLPDFFSK